MSTYYAGIDSGSWTTKAIVIDDATAVIGKAVVRTDAELSSAAERSFAEALEDAGVERSDLEAIWATGFGRQSVSFADSTRTELDCHARGVRHYIPGALTVVDIGGQDAKVIRLDEDGRRISHRMNRKCAAGTGSFLEEMSLRLGVRIDQFHDLALKFEEEFARTWPELDTDRWCVGSWRWTCWMDRWWEPAASLRTIPWCSNSSRKRWVRRFRFRPILKRSERSARHWRPRVRWPAFDPERDHEGYRCELGAAREPVAPRRIRGANRAHDAGAGGLGGVDRFVSDAKR
jgi:hypothetical protein